MTVTEWKEPALTWNGSAPEAGRARLLEIRSDAFIPDFLEGMASANPHTYFETHQKGAAYNPALPVKLFQPLHGCFYLVTASLVCRQLGLPDKAINRAAGENVFFVIRRRTAQGEEAWIQEGTKGHWLSLKQGEILAVAPAEERLPLHPVQVCSRPDTPHSVFTDFIERDIHYGYVPTGYRDKYKDTVGRLRPATDTPETLVNDFIAEAEADAGGSFSFRFETYRRRVHEPWLRLVDPATTFGAALPTTQAEQWLYTLVEMGDYFQNYLPTFWAALAANNRGLLGGNAAFEALFDRLNDPDNANVLLVSQGSSEVPVGEALRDLAPHFDLVRGQGSLPSQSYGNAAGAEAINTAGLTSLRALVESASAAEQQPFKLPGGAGSELARLVSEQVQPQPTTEPHYHIRTVYEYDPGCPPIVSSLPSQPFTFAKFFEPEAPARMIRLEAPSIKPQDLRRYARGVGIEMSPELHNLASCMAGGDMDGVIDSLQNCASGGLNVQMICSFSIQIIFLVAFIVMFIFLISLNFIFWWLAYLRICLPIPRKG